MLHSQLHLSQKVVQLLEVLLIYLQPALIKTRFEADLLPLAIPPGDTHTEHWFGSPTSSEWRCKAEHPGWASAALKATTLGVKPSL